MKCRNDIALVWISTDSSPSYLYIRTGWENHSAETGTILFFLAS